MRSPKLILLLILFLTFLPSTLYAVPTDDDDTESIIIEVEGEPEQYKAYMETYHPFIDVVAVYDTLFNGLALQGTPENLAKMEPLEFITNIHTVQQYEATPWENFKKTETSLQQPFDFNDTAYTGKGVKVGVIDTGIDYEHPDLELNYRSGYDLVDLDDDPMETVPEQGIPTSHGSHVAGIIAANGDIKGVAPNAEIYAYRALGPGGAGTTVQVLAAMEKAIEDDVDVINLSLGNNVNVPDYPTSMAVNRASEMGIPVVIANGNSGPDNWTVGSPATANEALSVGASTSPAQVPFLYESLEDKAIQLQGMAGSPAWELTQSNEIVDATNTSTSLNGKIALIKRGKIPFYELVKTAEKQGAVAVVIYNNQEGPLQGSVANEKDPITIPVAAISKEEGEWLKQETVKKKLYMETKYLNQETNVAPFSSRGPVTVNWNIKPDVVAPGTGILSTVPGGYEQMDGTSMAAPHVAGVVALIKEAHPDWTRDQIFGAIKTTANRMASENMPAPTIQGMGLIQPNEAIHTETIIHNPQLNFGKINEYREEHSLEVTFENLSDETKEYTFDYPKKENGIYWEIPQSFTLDAKEKKTITIELDVTTAKLEKGVHQGWLTVKENNEEYQLPYLFVNQSTDQPKTAGFEFALKNFSKDAYEYKLYVTEAARKVEVDLYHPDSLQFNRQLLEMDNLEPGLHEGELSKKEAGPGGYYLAIITVYLEDGTYESNQTMLYLE